MKKPTKEIERMREWAEPDGWLWTGESPTADGRAILANLDSLPEWPADLTRERLEELASDTVSSADHRSDALRRLAQIAPKREKRKGEIWQEPNNQLRVFSIAPPRDFPIATGWRKVGECEVDA